MDLEKPTTFIEQVEALKDKNITVDNTEACISFLKKNNYHRLSAYYLPFKDVTGKCFIDTTFEKLRHLYEFDQELRILILPMIEDIEIHLRTQIAYFHSHKYGAMGYESQVPITSSMIM